MEIRKMIVMTAVVALPGMPKAAQALCLKDKMNLVITPESVAAEAESLKSRALNAKPVWLDPSQGIDLTVDQDVLLVLPENFKGQLVHIKKLTLAKQSILFYSQDLRIVVDEISRESIVQLIDVASFNLTLSANSEKQEAHLEAPATPPPTPEPYNRTGTFGLWTADKSAASGAAGARGSNGRDAGGKIVWGIPKSTPSEAGGAGGAGGTGSNGRNGDNGAAGAPGLDAHTLLIQVEKVDVCSGLVIVTNGGSGAKGLKGQNAQNGGTGGFGGKGGRGGGSAYDRSASAGGRGGDGGAGGNGGNGGAGGDGGRGGSGGKVVAIIRPRFMDWVKVNDNIQVLALGGHGGAGGAKGLGGKGGFGGLGGDGGDGGDGSVFKGGGSSGMVGSAGANGRNGRDGVEGRTGVDGVDGVVTIPEVVISNDVSLADYLKK